MYLSRPEFIIGAVTDRVFGPYVAGLILHRVGVLPEAPTNAPSTDDDIDRDDEHPYKLTLMSESLKAYIYATSAADWHQFWREEGLGDTEAKLSDWRSLAGMSYPLRDADAPDLLFTPAAPTLAHITPWFRGNVFSKPHSQRWREQKFSTLKHLTVKQHGEFTKECMMLYHSTLKQFRLQQLSAELRQRVSRRAAEGVTKESELKGERSAAQVALHSQQLISLAQIYESLEEGGSLASTLTEVNEKVAALKTRRELEYAHHREQMAALREKGTSKMTEDAAAEVRTEDQRAAVWADMSERERSFARQQVVDSKAAASQAAANKAPAGQLKRLREEAERRKNVIPRLAHAGSLAVTRGQVVSASGRGK